MWFSVCTVVLRVHSGGSQCTVAAVSVCWFLSAVGRDGEAGAVSAAIV